MIPAQQMGDVMSKSDEETKSRATRTTDQVLAQQKRHAEREQQLTSATSTAVDSDDNFGAPATDDRIIQGELAKCVDGRWHDRDKRAIPSKVLALATFTIVQRWRDQKPQETIDGRVSALPDVTELNAAIPESEWETGIDGKPRPPWQRQEVVYLLDEATAQKYTFASGTVGATIAVEKLRDRVRCMRMLRHTRVIPIVELANAPMKTRHGVSKLRPDFKIAGWCTIGGDKATPLLEQVKPPTVAEELNDKIDF
jgi:hypothetical protein